ncbi:hypothetical protein VT84_09395 [Gemmata sp. SH-PL17]|uniref:hypothetical protein n=1 Tax=Gemmata sp. SH-PL17 TaxID=1630693 RepID=UPI00078D0643|nr:hypothetical protein [Gemmata sp. SH-PL17]AMV24598.1 hypothetical protein VT84_09395 [Gemmata sp. SH-PL17]
MAFLPGKFARFRAPAAIAGAFRWNIGFRRERLDLTNFESAISVSGNNVHSEGATGVLDTTFTVEMYLNDITINAFFPEAQGVCDLLYRKNVELGYKGVVADVLEFQPSTTVRDRAMGTVQFQANGRVLPAF